jgi:hypothetical protein
MRELSREIGHLSQQLELKVSEWFRLSLSLPDPNAKVTDAVTDTVTDAVGATGPVNGGDAP